MMSTPASKISVAVLTVIPAPPAAFSPLATTTSTCAAWRILGSSSRTARRPGSPTMSPINKMFTEARVERKTPNSNIQTPEKLQTGANQVLRGAAADAVGTRRGVPPKQICAPFQFVVDEYLVIQVTLR